jgi:hypothetical protein
MYACVCVWTFFLFSCSFFSVIRPNAVAWCYLVRIRVLLFLIECSICVCMYACVCVCVEICWFSCVKYPHDAWVFCKKNFFCNKRRLLVTNYSYHLLLQN